MNESNPLKIIFTENSLYRDIYTRWTDMLNSNRNVTACSWHEFINLSYRVIFDSNNLFDMIWMNDQYLNPYAYFSLENEKEKETFDEFVIVSVYV